MVIYKGDEQKQTKVELFLLVALLAVFLAYSIFISVKTDTGIIPDEPAHFTFSKHYSTTWGRPPDTFETYSTGWYIEQNPFLYYWINGRIINLVQFINPSVNDATLLLLLRLLSCLYSVGTLFFVYLLSKLIIHKAWWPLLPVFLFSNTLMFVFLSGGVNYDNMANLFSMAGIYFLTRVFAQKDYAVNSLGWMIFIALGCLVKYTITPLALFAFIVWVAYYIKQRKQVFPLRSWNRKKTSLVIILFVLIYFNASIYGYNILVYQSLTPNCADLLNTTQCAISPYQQRYEKLGLEKRMTLLEAVQQGFPHPLAYVFDFWIKDMVIKTQGIAGHKVYIPSQIIPFYQLFYLGVLCLAFQSWKGINYQNGSLLFLIILYSLVLIRTNYRSELLYRFQHMAIQGRYLFPITGPVYILVGYTLSQVQNKVIRYGSVVASVVLFLAGGPIKFLKLYETVFFDWFL